MIGDEAILRDLRLQALTDAPEAFGSTYSRELARTTADWQRWLSPGITLTLEDAGTARGLVAGMRDPDDSSIVYLMAMWVHPDLRGSGGSDARRQDHATRRHRHQRFRLYERHGFHLTGRETARLRDGQIELQMERPT